MAKCRDLSLKISYSRTISKMAAEILQRNTRYLEPMNKWIRCPDPKYKDNATKLFTTFLSEVDCMAKDVQDTTSRSTTRGADRAYAMWEIQSGQANYTLCRVHTMGHNAMVCPMTNAAPTSYPLV